MTMIYLINKYPGHRLLTAMRSELAQAKDATEREAIFVGAVDALLHANLVISKGLSDALGPEEFAEFCQAVKALAPEEEG